MLTENWKKNWRNNEPGFTAYGGGFIGSFGRDPMGSSAVSIRYVFGKVTYTYLNLKLTAKLYFLQLPKRLFPLKYCIRQSSVWVDPTEVNKKEQSQLTLS